MRKTIYSQHKFHSVPIPFCFFGLTPSDPPGGCFGLLSKLLLKALVYYLRRTFFSQPEVASWPHWKQFFEVHEIWFDPYFWGAATFRQMPRTRLSCLKEEVEAFVVLLTEGLIFCAEYNSRSRSIFVGWTHVNFKTGQCEPKWPADNIFMILANFLNYG